MRPINQKPTWLETILLRPIKVECWSCLQFAWLHRNQQIAPSDWTCPNCLTHQRRDKNGDIIPVPEIHQRVVYQLLSNYIPEEEDENYQAYYENADTYKRQLEERYPLACEDCLEKIILALTLFQNGSLLNYLECSPNQLDI
ncbi:hypothetical protein BGZ76_002082 [Entomortierella beljakovae]|nr:hypothetical protein BGZ76_002082 [Entomortierella beljakovae]